MSKWICTRCAGSDVKVLEGRPSIDERFAVGWCDRCTPRPVWDPKKPGQTKPLVRGTVPLALDPPANRESIAERDRTTREKKLVEKALSGAIMPDADRERAVEIRRR